MIGYLKGLINGTKPTVTRSQILNAQPVRNPTVDWERGETDSANDGLALLRIPRKAGAFSDGVARFMKLPDFRKLELDEIGTDVWSLCDGEHSVDAIAETIVRKYKLNRRQAEASVTAYLKMLAERKLIALKTGLPAATSTSAINHKKQKSQSGKRKRV